MARVRRTLLAVLLPTVLCPALSRADDYVRTIGGVSYTLQDFSYHNAATGTKFYDVAGRLYIPPSYDPSQPTAVLMFLAGLGENGHDNTSQVNYYIDNILKNARTRNFIVYAPQSEDGWWPELPKAVNMLGKLAQNYNVDPSRLYVTGLSAGGGGTQLAVQDYTNLFSAYVPVALARYSYATPAAAAVAVGRPVWYYVARDDSMAAGNRNCVRNVVQAQGGTAPTFLPYSNTTTDYQYSYGTMHYTEYATGGHSNDTWGRAYGEAQLYDWMLQQSSPVTKPAPGRTIHVNFSATSTPAGMIDTQGTQWNVSGGTGFSSSTEFSLSYAKDNTGARTTASFEVTRAFGGMGTSVPAITAFADPTVADSYWLTASNIAGELTLRGLTPDAAYDLSLFASITGTDGGRGHKGLYAIDGQSVLFESSDNLDKFVNFTDLHADSGGNLVLSVTPPAVPATPH